MKCSATRPFTITSDPASQVGLGEIVAYRRRECGVVVVLAAVADDENSLQCSSLTDRQTDRQTDGRTDRQTDRPTDRPTDRQTDNKKMGRKKGR